MLINKYTTPKLQLKITDNILSIPSLPNELMKETYEYFKNPISKMILANPYELITFSKIKQTIDSNIYNVDIIINNKNIIIDKYILAPFTTYKSNTYYLASTYFFYHSIEFKLKNKKLLIIKLIFDDYDIQFFLEKYLIEKHNYSIDDITSIFITFGNINIQEKYNYNYKIINYDKLDLTELNTYLDMYDAIYINTIRIAKNIKFSNCYYDIINLPYLLFIFTISLNHLKENGDLFIYHLFPMLSYSYIGLFYYIFTLFHSIEQYDNIIENDIGLYHLKKYNGKTTLNKIFNAYYKVDSKLGLHNYIKNYDDYKIMYCNTTNHNKFPNTNDKLIQSLVSEIHPDFIQYMYNIYIKFNKKLALFNEKCNTIKMKNIHSILSHNIQICKEFCDKHNIEIQPYYLNFKPVTYKKVIKTYFIHKKNINFDNLKMNTDSIYSITLPNDSIKMSQHINKIFPMITTIIDGTSNVGTNTIVMAEYFEKILACEIDKTTFKYLKENIKEYNLKNVKCHNGSIITFMKENKFDLLTTCLYLDPPWSGIHYKLETTLDLYLDNINVVDFIKDINIQYICMKVPFNYNFKSIIRKFTDMQVYHLSSFFFILLTK